MRKSIAIIVLLLTALGMSAGEIHVSPRGSDSNAGTANSPLATLSEALKQTREWRRLGDSRANGGIDIILADGIYRQSTPVFIRPEDSGTPSSPTTIKGSGAVISGGMTVTGWHKGCDDPRIPEDLRQKIWVAEAPMHEGRIVETRQLWVGSAKAQRASQFAPGVMERMVDFRKADESIIIPAANVPQSLLLAPQGLEMVVHQRWAIAILRVRDMVREGDNIRVTFRNPESHIEFAHPWPQPVIGGEKGNSSYFLQGALELLDTPGEWYQDYPSGMIYYMPREGEDLATTDVTIPLLETILKVSGTMERPVHDIRFSGISFEHSSWLRPSLEGHVTLQGGFQIIDAYKLLEPGLPEKAELENQAWIGRPETAVSVNCASGISFENCSFTHLANTGLDLLKAVTDSRIQGCRFTDIGGTALQMGHFPDQGFETHVPYKPLDEKELCSGITVSGNTVSDATNEDWGCVGIGAGYVRDVNITANEVCRVNYSGICVGWGWTALESGMRNNHIDGNSVHDFALQLYDAGGIYTLSNQPGSTIKNNNIYNIGRAPYATNDRGFYIYFDEATDGYTVTGNTMPSELIGYNKPGPAMVIKNNNFKK